MRFLLTDLSILFALIALGAAIARALAHRCQQLPGSMVTDSCHASRWRAAFIGAVLLQWAMMGLKAILS